MKSALFFWFLASSLAAQNASVEGTVVNKSTGQPVSGVHIRLIDAAGMDDETAGRVYGAISDRAGHYSITGIDPGAYVALLDRTGFAGGWSSGSRPPIVALKAGDHLTDHKFEISPAAYLSGRVLDENGDPVRFTFVQVLRGSDGENFAGGRATNDRGEFRISVPPGRYRLQAEPQMQGDGIEIRNGSPLGRLRITYYPSATAAGDASIVEVGASQEVAGLDIHLVRDSLSGAHSLSISGTVTGIPERSPATVLIRSGDSPTALYDSTGGGVGPDGSFAFRGLEAKYYRVTAQVSTGKVHMQSQSIDFHLTADQANVQLILQPAEELSGLLVVAGGALPPGKKPVLLFDGGDFFGAPASQSAEVAADGSFHVPGMLPAKYNLHVDSVPETAYVKSILLDGASVEGEAVDLSRGVKSARLKVTIGLDSAELSGKILGHDGAPLQSPMGFVMIWKHPNQTDPDMQKVTEGRYTLKGLRPGKLRVLAVDTLDFADSDSSDGSEEEMQKAALAASEEIEAKPGDRLVKDLKVVDKEKLNVKKQ